jgi:tripartite-type tricarboxylate transporter receptor subunit TctC
MNPHSKIAGLLAGLLLTGAALAQGYPAKPVSLMVPYPAGGLSDVIARSVNVSLAARLGQPVLIENLGGGAGSIGAQKVLNAPADGYTLFQGSPNEIVLAPLANKAVKYTSDDFQMVQFIADSPLAITVRKGLEANTADELVALARRAAREGKPLNYASVGYGSFYHLLGEELARIANAPMLHVPYKGGADVSKDLIGGVVDIFITPYGKPHVALAQQGRFKFIAALSPARQPGIPEVPSVDEGIALKGFHQSIWTGYFVKKGTPAPVLATLHKALSDTLGDEKLRATLAAQSLDVPKPVSQAEAEKAYVAGAKKFQAIAKAAGLKAQ